MFNKKNLYSLNLARNSLELLLKAIKPTCIHAPYYTCHSIHKVLEKLVPEVRYYHIDENFFPLIPDCEVNDDQFIIINNYFGVFEESVNFIIKQYGSRVIVDNSQAFYSLLPDSVDQIFSPRKFFGVTDGGFLLTKKNISYLYHSLGKDQSADRVKHLFVSDETSKNDSYKDFLLYRKNLQSLEPMKMSVSTQEIIKTIDIEYCKRKRKSNFERMNELIGKYNLLDIPIDSNQVPMCYPLLTKCQSLRHDLVKKNIYVGTYWPISPIAQRSSTFEDLLRSNLCCLPIDQSMTDNDVQVVSDLAISLIRDA